LPLFYQHNINEGERLGVWKIEEDEDFFLKKVPPNPDITHEHKRLQHLAGRYLLQQLFPDFPYQLIQIADTRKPFLFNEAYHFSISHCDNYAAALVSKWHRVGVDIEVITETIGKIRHKFLNDFEIEILEKEATDLDASLQGKLSSNLETISSDAESDVQVIDVKTGGNAITLNSVQQWASASAKSLPDQLALLTLCWSAKEAMYKWYGNGLVDFKNHMQLTGFHNEKQEGWIPTEFIFQKEKPVPLVLRSRFFGDAVLTYVIS
jgi:phosphopantetheinyl transferase